MRITKSGLEKMIFGLIAEAVQSAAPTAPTPEAIAPILQANRDKLVNRGIDIDDLSVLGVGTMGVAYDMGSHVLKVTKDPKEAKASSIVAGKNIPNIIQIYDIWQFAEPYDAWYGLILEKVKPLTAEDEKVLTDAVIATGFPVYLYKNNDDWNVAMQAMARDQTKFAVKNAYKKFPQADPANKGAGITDPQVRDFVKTAAKKTIDDFNRITKEYNMRSLFKSLKSLGIQYYDFHGGNYGRREDGTLVLFDLGRSISKGVMPPKLLETFKLLEERFGTPKPIKFL